MLQGETVESGGKHPGTELRVLNTPAGYYLGYLDKDGLVWSRETGYWATRSEADYALVQWRHGNKVGMRT